MNNNVYIRIKNRGTLREFLFVALEPHTSGDVIRFIIYIYMSLESIPTILK